MKKQLLYFLFIGSVSAASAQITITQADMAPIGFNMFRGIDTACTTVIIGGSGASMSWDYSLLTEDQGDTVSFVDPSTMADYSKFPSSNLGIILSGQGEAYALQSSTDVQIIGQGISFNAQHYAAAVSPGEFIIKFPTTFITNWNNTSQFNIAIPFTQINGVDSARVSQTKTKNVIVDAWGSLTTPMGTFNVVRQKEAVQVDQNIEIHTTGPLPPAAWYPYQSTTTNTTTYNYWANGVGFPVMTIDSADATGSIDVTWLKQAPAAGIKTIANNNDDRVYPNPASSNMYIMLDKNNGVKVNVYDLQGKLVMQTEANSAIAELNVLSLEKGFYTYSVSTLSGEFVRSGKFVISR